MWEWCIGREIAIENGADDGWRWSNGRSGVMVMMMERVSLTDVIHGYR